MTALRKITARLRRLFTLTPEQAEQLAKIKFPCC